MRNEQERIKEHDAAEAVFEEALAKMVDIANPGIVSAILLNGAAASLAVCCELAKLGDVEEIHREFHDAFGKAARDVRARLVGKN